MLFGAHVSAAGGFSNAFTRGKDIGASSIQVFTQSPRAWKPSQLNDQDLEAFHSKMAKQAKSNQILAVFCHATYLINLASPEKDLYNRSIECLVENLKVASALRASGLIVHVGSHRGSGFDKARKQIAKALKTAFNQVPGEIPILLENTAGAGDTIGRSLEELAILFSDITEIKRTGACIDTQHLFASGVSFSSRENVENFVSSVENTIGI
ncbi:MAG: deoxyribonuclease IV, partial [Acidimicrobiales bacterium]|nr:deoxyribonuclease IV [Acidimicrobiales bacterium]